MSIKDRDYWRGESNTRLIEEARYNPTSELAIVLAERLKEEEYKNWRRSRYDDEA